jgi:sugar/nucleoside kinase (ribokinase family)
VSPVPVLFVGDLNVDLLLTGLESAPEEDREVFCSGRSRALGGSTAVAAAAYARLGGTASMAALVGADEDGVFLRGRLAAAGVDCSRIASTSAVGTGLTVNLVRGNTRTQVTYPGALANFAPDKTLFAGAGFRHLHVSGPYGQASLRPVLAGLLKAARGTGMSLSLDTQWDPEGRWEGLETWLPLVDYLFVNAGEAKAITSASDAAAAATRLHALTANPVVKLGGAGALFRGLHRPARAVRVVDTTGAGDTFAAGFLAGLFVEGRNPEGALDWALAAGSLACTWVGGDSDSLDRDSLKRYLP